MSEGEEVNYSAIASDAGNDTLTYSWDFGDGNTASGQDVTHTFADNGNYTITLTVTDEDNASINSTLDVTVNNVTPLITEIIGKTNVSEGEEVNYSAIALDAGNDTLTYSWDFGDGNTASGQDVTHAFSDNGNYTITLTVTDDDGATATSTLNVAVNNVAPVIEEIVGDTNVSEGEEISYSAIASDKGNDTLTYNWDFGDGNSATGIDVTHTFTDNGIYKITLTVTDDDNGSTTSTLDITVNNVAPVIDKIIGDTNVKEGEEVSYSAIASDQGKDALTYAWDFGDGSDLVEGENVTHTFSDNGNYTITLTVSDDDGATATQTLDVVVNNVAPSIIEIVGKTNVEEGEEISYSAIAFDKGNDTLTYNWNFGDGNTASGQNVTHTFADNGNYTITLTVTDEDNASINSTLNVTVNNVAPVITEIIGDTDVEEGKEVIYSANASDRGNDALTYSWDFGDGSPQLTVNGEQLPVTHTFANNGSYTITLTVKDKDNASTTSTLDITVNNVAPTITEIIGKTDVSEGEEVNYQAIASDQGNDTLTYSWDFGDGNTASGQGVTHAFADNGNYTITLTVTDDDSATATSTLNVTVNNVAPVIEEIIGDTNVEEGEEISYSAIASEQGNDALTYAWDFGDGSDLVEGENVTHTFSDNGNYIITLIVSDDDGATATQTLDVVVNNVAPSIIEIVGKTNVKEGEEITYSAIASEPGNDALTYSWNFGDGTTASGIDVTHIFTDNGNYTIALTVSDDEGATVSSTLDVTVNNVAPVITSFTGDSEIDEGYTASFVAIASDKGEDALTYAWDFGDGSETVFGENVLKDTASHIEHLFAENGLYDVSVTVTDDDGAKVTQSFTITVNNVTPVIDPWLDETGNEGEEINFNATFSDPGILDNHLIEWDFGDGSAIITETIAPSQQTTYNLSQTHTYSEDGNYTVTLTVTDDDGAVATNTMTVTVNNLAPVITSLSGDTNVEEGQPANFSAIAFDAGNDILTYNWDFGDGNTASGQDVNHTFTDNGNYTVTLTVTDDDGAATTSTLGVTVNNVAPTITEIIGKTNVEEGEEVNYQAIASDAGNDTLTYSWNFGDNNTASGKDVTHTFTEDGNYTVTLTVTDDDGDSSTSTLGVSVNTASEFFNIKAEGKVRINSSSDFDGEPLNYNDDTRIYAGGGFTFNGNQTLPIQRDAAGKPLKVNGKSVLVDRAVTVGPNYTESNAAASSQKYANLIPPQVIDPLSVNVPNHIELVSSQIAKLIPSNTTEIIFNPQLKALNNVSDWQKNFPAPGSITNPTVVRIKTGNLNIPSSINLANYVIILDNGSINFNGTGHSLNNVGLLLHNGSINLASVNSNHVSILVNGSINMNGGARFAGDSLLASGNSNGQINFNGATVNTQPGKLEVIAQGSITFNGSSTTIGAFKAKNSFTFNGNSTLIGSIQTKGDIIINGQANIIR